MAGTTRPAYGTPNWEMIKRWLELAPEEDGPFWALNLMKYRTVAEYTRADDAPMDAANTLSGKEADDAYAPLGPLAAVGAMVAFHGDVLEQPAGTPIWDRIGIVRYPTRAAFFAMQQRDDFKTQHVHKEAGMEFTIVMSCLPNAFDAHSFDASTRLVLSVERGAIEPASLPRGAELVADFTVEGVIVGDERTFDRARFVQVADDAALAAIVTDSRKLPDAHVLVVDRAIDRLLASITSPTEA